MLDFLLVFNLPKLVFDDEMCGQALRFVRDIRPDRRPAGRRPHRPADGRPAPDHGRAHDGPLAGGALPALGDRRPRQPRELDEARRARTPTSGPSRRSSGASRRTASPRPTRAIDAELRRIIVPGSRTRPSCRSSRAAEEPTEAALAATAGTRPAAQPASGRLRPCDRSATEAEDRPRPLRPVDPAAGVRAARAALAHDIATLAAFCRVRRSRSRRTARPRCRRRSSAGRWRPAPGRSPSRTRGRPRSRSRPGIERILIANEVVDDAGLDWIGELLDRDGAELLVLADSVAGVGRMAARLAGRRRRLPGPVDIGVAGGRTGVRTDDEAEAVAAAIEAADALTAGRRLALRRGRRAGRPRRSARRPSARMTDRTRASSASSARCSTVPGSTRSSITGGGSTYPDVVAEELSRPWDAPQPVRVVLRSGAYVTHDHGIYERSSPFGMRAAPGAPRLQPAIEVWAPVLSVARARARLRRRRPARPAGRPGPAGRHQGPRRRRPRPDRPTGFHGGTAQRPARVPRAGGRGHVAVGDLVAFGISHPCTAFQLWREALVVDDADRILDVYELLF